MHEVATLLGDAAHSSCAPRQRRAAESPSMNDATPPADVAAPRLQPLASMPAGALRGAVGVLSDIDDTLSADGRIEAAALAALQRLAAAGVPVIAVTGRPAGWSEDFAMRWPVEAIVAENGAVMLRRAGGRLQRSFAQPRAEREANFRRLQHCAAAVLARVHGSRLATDSAGRLTDIAVDHGEFAHLEPAQIDAVVAIMREHGLNATVSSIHVNGWIGSHDKFSGARWAVRETLGIALDPRRWLYVGDSTNDQLMFEHFELSVGVANIRRFLPQLAVPPTYLCRHERGAGFAELADALLAARVAP